MEWPDHLNTSGERLAYLRGSLYGVRVAAEELRKLGLHELAEHFDMGELAKHVDALAALGPREE